MSLVFSGAIGTTADPHTLEGVLLAPAIGTMEISTTSWLHHPSIHDILLLTTNVSLAEITAVIVCGCLPVLPKLFQLLKKKYIKSEPSYAHAINNHHVAKQSHNQWDNFLTAFESPTLSAAGHEPGDSGAGLIDNYSPSTELDSSDIWRVDDHEQVTSAGKSPLIRKAAPLKTRTRHGEV
ncbi:hypothetical protein MMC17_003198 [Xylographa soralifera]|nr:hypothetical protein [Xylographa soralifera]